MSETIRSSIPVGLTIIYSYSVFNSLRNQIMFAYGLTAWILLLHTHVQDGTLSDTPVYMWKICVETYFFINPRTIQNKMSPTPPFYEHLDKNLAINLYLVNGKLNTIVEHHWKVCHAHHSDAKICCHGFQCTNKA